LRSFRGNTGHRSFALTHHRGGLRRTSQSCRTFCGRAADTRATFRGRNSSLVRIFGFFGNKYSPYPLRSEHVALFSLNFQTLHEKHSMASWLLAVHRVHKSIIFVEDWHPGGTYASNFQLAKSFEDRFTAATLTRSHLNRFCPDRSAFNRSAEVHQKCFCVCDVVAIPLVHAKFLENCHYARDNVR
jgi:hypothetical protein